VTTVYTAPSTYDASNNSATLTASISDEPSAKQVVAITITKPSTSTSGIPGLVSSVTVTYDERDIPTINCTKSVDCYSVLGFIHARDRLFQMDFYRRVGRGTLSELVGEGGLDQDQATRTIFTTRDGKSLAEELAAYNLTDPLVGPILTAYTAG
jgi:penicillin amidase